MDNPETIFHVAMILRCLCYLSGMAVFISMFLWLGRIASGYENIYGIGRTICIWLVRIVAMLAIISLLFMMITWRSLNSPFIIFPEISILLLISALHLLLNEERPLQWRLILKRKLPMEVLKIIGVTLLAMAGWALSIALAWGLLKITLAAGGADWLAVFIVGVIWNSAALALFFRANSVNNNLELGRILWPMLLAYALIIFPDFIEHLFNSLKIHALLNTSSLLQRI